MEGVKNTHILAAAGLSHEGQRLLGIAAQQGASQPDGACQP